jgi:hypothetical protein
MTPASNATTPPNAPDVIEAMRSLQTEGDAWRLAEALLARVPVGDNSGFDEIMDEAAAANVLGKLSKKTLMLYRDAANRWPADKRIANVSFSAHREALVLENINESVRLLEQLVKANGAAGVTVQSVRKAIAVKRGTVKAAPAGAAATAPKAAVDMLADLRTGAKALIGAIGADTEDDELVKLHAGLTKTLAHVERLQAKAARKAATAAKRATTPWAPRTPSGAAPAKKRPAPRKATAKVDLRNAED